MRTTIVLISIMDFLHGILMDRVWPLAGLADCRGRCASLAVRPHVSKCVGASVPRVDHVGKHGLGSATGALWASGCALLFGRPSASKPKKESTMVTNFFSCRH